MKKNLLLCAGMFIFLAAGAQYKKASFLNKSGRIYDIGATMMIQGNERGSASGFFLSYGKENADKRVHHWYDTEVMLSSTYKYTTFADGDPGIPVTVTGKTGSTFTIRYNFGYFLTDNSDAKTKLSPFVNLALGYTGGWGYGTETYSPDTYPYKRSGDQPSAFIYGGGAGIVYRFSPLLGLRLSAAYYGTADGEKESPTLFKKLVNHPAVSLALRFKMNRGD